MAHIGIRTSTGSLKTIETTEAYKNDCNGSPTVTPPASIRRLQRTVTPPSLPSSYSASAKKPATGGTIRGRGPTTSTPDPRLSGPTTVQTFEWMEESFRRSREDAEVAPGRPWTRHHRHQGYKTA
jgi:hypothetical protein